MSLPEKVTPWMPMDSAPDDGTVVWLWGLGTERLAFFKDDLWRDVLLTAEDAEHPRQIMFTPSMWRAADAEDAQT